MPSPPKKKGRKRPLEEPVLRFLKELANSRGFQNVHVTERIEKPGDPIVVDHNAGLFYEVLLRRVDIPVDKAKPRKKA